MFYVTQVRDGRKWRKVSEGFASREEAEGQVEEIRKRVIAADPWSHFDAFGVTKVEGA